MFFESKIDPNLGTRPQIANQVSVTPSLSLDRSETLSMLHEWFVLLQSSG